MATILNPASARMADWWHGPVLHLQILLASAFLFGGGGSAYGLANLIVQFVALACLAINHDRAWHFFRHGPRMLVALVGLTVAVPLVQAIPLPPSLWQGLPGRDLVTDAWQAVGLPTDGWFQISLNRSRTLMALGATFTPAAMIIIGSTLTRAELARLALTFIALALADLALGIVQLSSANTLAVPYDEAPERDVLYGLLANRNSHGLMLVCALVMLAATPLPLSPRLREKLGTVVKAAVGGLLAIGVVLTQSRSSMALLAMVLLVIAAVAVRQFAQAKGASARSLWIALLLAGAIGVAAIASLQQGGRVSESLARFSETETDRPEMWEDGIYAARHYWPVGAGTGAFEDVFQVDESLEYVSVRRAGRVHQDYIEVAIESGIVGVLLLAAWLAWAAMATLRRDPPAEWRWRGWAGVGLACIALQSLLDYPLRNQLMLAAAGLLVAMLVRREWRAAP